MITVVFTDNGFYLGVEGGMSYEEAAELVRKLKEALGELAELGLFAWEGEIEQHRHEESYAHVHAHEHA